LAFNHPPLVLIFFAFDSQSVVFVVFVVEKIFLSYWQSNVNMKKALSDLKLRPARGGLATKTPRRKDEY
jgi:hypothetical protein